MKKLIKFAFLGVAMLGVTLAGCSREEQSSLNIDDITTFTRIVGTVNYSAGQNFQNGQFIELTGTPTGRVVFVEVPHTALGGSTGSKVFTTTVSADGTFDIEIPLVTPTANVSVFAEPFQATFREFESVSSAGTPQFKSTNALFHMSSPQSVTVQRNNANVAHLVYGHTLLENEDVINFNTTITLSGRIGQATARDTTAAGAFYALRSGLLTLLEISYFDASGYVTTRTFGAATNSEGVYTITIPAWRDVSHIGVTVNGVPFAGNFTHFYSVPRDGEPNAQASMSLTGYFSATTTSADIHNILFGGAVNHLPEASPDDSRLRYNFTPAPDGQIPADRNQFNPLWWTTSTDFVVVQ
ncbi:MAG: hypothetical protein FWC94_04955 [Bacteroidales bacterium]|nr:hypothetical protein [Bacteroidales bacterium]